MKQDTRNALNEIFNNEDWFINSEGECGNSKIYQVIADTDYLVMEFADAGFYVWEKVPQSDLVERFKAASAA